MEFGRDITLEFYNTAARVGKIFVLLFGQIRFVGTEHL
jgi:hypothetical protein